MKNSYKTKRGYHCLFNYRCLHRRYEQILTKDLKCKVPLACAMVVGGNAEVVSGIARCQIWQPQAGVTRLKMDAADIAPGL